MTLPPDGWLPSVEGSELTNRALPSSYEALYWSDGDGSALQESYEVSHEDLALEEEEADVAWGRDQTSTLAIQATLRRNKAYGSILLDSHADPGVTVERIGPEGFYFGLAGGSDLLEFGQADDDAGSPIVSRMVHRAIAPMGAVGEAIFTHVRPTLTVEGEAQVTLTPIIDGEELTGEAASRTYIAAGQRTLTPEMELGRGSSGRRHLRGTWFRLKVELEQTENSGYVSLDALEIEFEPVRETTEALTFHQENLQPAALSLPTRFYFGASNTVGRFGASRDDMGAAVELIASSNPLAPAGTGQEAIFRNLYLALTRANPSDVPLNVEAVVDETRYTVATRTLEGVAGPKLELLEIPLTTAIMRSGSPVGRRHLRGTWCEFRLDTDGTLPDGDLVLEAAGLEFEPVQESEGDLGG